MFENIEDKFKKLMNREGLGKLAEKPNDVFIARFFSEDEPPKVIVEFETKEEIDDWYNSQGKWLEEEEGRIKIEVGPSELHQDIKEGGLEKLIKPTGYKAVIKHFGSEEPKILGEFKTKEEFEEWYKSTGAAYEDAAQERIKLEEIFGEGKDS